MITLDCRCGMRFQVLNAQVAERARCPKCGTRAADLLAAEPVAAPEQVACANHPGQPATHNCLHCGKPVCMECVHALGYYCSADCRAAVASIEPDAVTTEERAAAASSEQVVARAAGTARKIAWIGAFVVVVGVAWWAVRTWWAPKGTITARLPVPSAVGSFHCLPAGQDAVVVQAHQELSLVRLPALTKAWTVTLEELVELEAVQDDTILLRSPQHLSAVDRANGAVRWKFAEPDSWLRVVTVHPRGVWCMAGKAASLVNLSLANGQVTCSLTNVQRAEVVCAGNQTLLLILLPGKVSEEELTAGGVHGLDLKSLLKRTHPGREVDYELRVLDTGTGQFVEQKRLRLAEDAKLQAVGDTAVITAGRDVHWLPHWHATLPANVRAVAHQGEVVAVATDEGVTALDASTGHQRWARTGFDVAKLVVGPDGSVYATVSLTKETTNTGEAAQYRVAAVSERTMGAMPVYVALVKLNGRTGATQWGVRNIGREVLFDGDLMFVVDHLVQMDLLDSNLMAGYYSVRRLSPRDGQDQWRLLRRGDVYHQQVTRSKVLIAAADHVPTGRGNPTCPYELRLIEGR